MLFYLNRIAQAYNSCTWEVEEGKSKVQGHPQLHSELEAGLDCMRPHLKSEAKGLARDCLRGHV